MAAVYSSMSRVGAAAVCKRSARAYPLYSSNSTVSGSALGSQISVNIRTHSISSATAASHFPCSALPPVMTASVAELHTKQAWEFWRRLGSPKYHVAPMVDQVQGQCHRCVL